MSELYDFSKVKEYKLYTVLTPLAKAVCKTVQKCTYIGTENIPKTGGFILACNHMSTFDPIALGGAGKRVIHFMAKEELFENKALGAFITHLNAFPVVRGKGDMTAITHAEEILRNGWVLGIFPEGTRSEDYAPKRAKSGVALIAKQTGADVLPVSIYTDEEYKRGTRLTVRFGRLIKKEEFGFTEDGKSRELKEASRRIMDDITKLWEEGHCKK